MSLKCVCCSSNQGAQKTSPSDLNADIKTITSHCTKTGENGEIVTISITTEESHQATLLGKFALNDKPC